MIPKEKETNPYGVRPLGNREACRFGGTLQIHKNNYMKSVFTREGPSRQNTNTATQPNNHNNLAEHLYHLRVHHASDALGPLHGIFFGAAVHQHLVLRLEGGSFDCIFDVRIFSAFRHGIVVVVGHGFQQLRGALRAIVQREDVVFGQTLPRVVGCGGGCGVLFVN
jgi:hypothetical protein